MKGFIILLAGFMGVLFARIIIAIIYHSIVKVVKLSFRLVKNLWSKCN